MPKISFKANDNPSRPFPDAFEVEGAEFKVNGKYLCFEPCGGGSSFKYGDIIIYVETTGDDVTGDGSQGNPFASLERAFDEAHSFITLAGDIYIYVGSGEYILSTTIDCIHPNKIKIKGTGITTPIINFDAGGASSPNSIFNNGSYLHIENIKFINNHMINIYLQQQGTNNRNFTFFLINCVFESGINISMYNCYEFSLINCDWIITSIVYFENITKFVISNVNINVHYI